MKDTETVLREFAYKVYDAGVARIAEAVAAERERCAKVCEEFYSVEGIAQKCAEAIRKGE